MYLDHKSNRAGKSTLQPRIFQKDRRSLDAIASFLNEQGILTCFYRTKSALGGPCWTLCIKQKSAIAFLSSIQPWLLTEKKTVAQDIIRFRKIWPPMPPGSRGHTLLSREGRYGAK